MTMNALILADAFVYPGYAPRLRSFCEAMIAAGMGIDVYAEKGDSLDFPHSYPVHEVNFYCHNHCDWPIKALWSLITDWKERRFARIIHRSIGQKQYDVVVCTTFSTFPLGAAVRLASELKVPLVADVRDVEEQVPNLQYQRHRQWFLRPMGYIYSAINRRRRNRFLQKAACVTTVSSWHVDFLRRFNSNVRLISNGFSSDIFFPTDIPTDHFVISYVGRLYEFQRLEMLVNALAHMRHDMPELQWHVYSHQCPECLPLEDWTFFHEYVSYDAVPDIIRRSSVSVVLTDTRAKGMMTTKFYEILGCEKPVLCVPSDNGVLADAITAHNAGAACSTQEEIVSFVSHCYDEWRQNGFTRQPVRNAGDYDRNALARDFVQLLVNLVS